MPRSPESMASRLIRWQRCYGRHDLPWQGTRDAYRIWLSEIMLQQTRVATVVPYYRRFVARFPTLAALAAASEDEVLALWSGLGYYRRARNLLQCARRLLSAHGGSFPHDPVEIARLPGIGRSTAAAIAVFAWGRRAAILDGNARRVLARWAGVRGLLTDPDVMRSLWQLAERQLPEAQPTARQGFERRGGEQYRIRQHRVEQAWRASESAAQELSPSSIEAYTQGLMDLGAGVCTRTRPACTSCPLSVDCVARVQGLTDAIPVRRARAGVPLRHAVWLVVRSSDAVLLEKRPSAGLWGGLWCLPQAQASSSDDLVDEIRQRFALRVEERGALSPVDHAFTHFRLRARPLLFETCPESAAACQVGDASTGLRWLRAAQAREAALPAPVRRLLLTLP